MPLDSNYYKYLALLKLSPFERWHDGWRFGTRRIAASVVDRLIASGRAMIEGDRVGLVPELPPRHRDALGRWCCAVAINAGHVGQTIETEGASR